MYNSRCKTFTNSILWAFTSSIPLTKNINQILLTILTNPRVTVWTIFSLRLMEIICQFIAWQGINECWLHTRTLHWDNQNCVIREILSAHTFTRLMPYDFLFSFNLMHCISSSIQHYKSGDFQQIFSYISVIFRQGHWRIQDICVGVKQNINHWIFNIKLYHRISTQFAILKCILLLSFPLCILLLKCYFCHILLDRFLIALSRVEWGYVSARLSYLYIGFWINKNFQEHFES